MGRQPHECAADAPPAAARARRGAPPRALLAALLAACIAAAPPTTLPGADAAGGDAWRGRVIYQLLVDRFDAPGMPREAGCPDLRAWCGGTLAGVTRRLDYISDLGADAIWISPVVRQCGGAFGGGEGYHGYWAQGLYDIEPRIGTAGDMRALSDAAHARGLLVMLDVVANHMGPCGVEGMDPFDRPSHYHDCGGCDAACGIPPSAWDAPEEATLEHCRLAGLPDLNQTHPFVREKLLAWVGEMVSNYSLDGLRVDTAPFVARPFWRDFADAAGVFSMGEAWFAGVDRVPLVASYAGPGALDSVLSYPLYGLLRGVFGGRQDMRTLLEVRRAYQAAFSPEALGLLGVFVENHDNPRFLSYQPDLQLYKNALTWVMMSEGIPIIYYGSEQGFAGESGATPTHDGGFRQPLWPSGFERRGPLFAHIQLLARHRKAQRLWEAPQIDVHAAPDCFAFARGATVVVTTNAGGGGGARCEFELPEGGPLPAGGRLVNIFEPQAPDVQMDPQSRRLTLDILNGSPLVLLMRDPSPAPAPTAAAGAGAPAAAATAARTAGSGGGVAVPRGRRTEGATGAASPTVAAAF
ncbi:MAG: glycoside hydrolase superfamily [Monoraphidium minutum]|nr:MAG: glycoside hydrolase superfamily [Monoraphidium minutum]